MGEPGRAGGLPRSGAHGPAASLPRDLGYGAGDSFDRGRRLSQSFGARVRAARQAAGLSQTVLAGTLMSASYLSLIEAGRREPSEAMVAGLAQRLGLPASVLLGDEALAAALNPGRDIAHLRILVTTGDYAAADGLATRLLEQRPGHWMGADAGAVQHLRGLAREGQGALDDALDDLRAARAAVRLAGDVRSAVVITIDLLRCLRERGDLAEALREAAALADALPAELVHSPLHAKLVSTLIGVHYLLGDFALAQQLAVTAVAEFDANTEPSARAMVLWNASLAAEARGDVRGALLLASEASELMSSGGERRLVGQLHVAVAWLRSRLTPPDLDGARTALVEAATAFGMAAAPLDLAALRHEQARLAWLSGDLSAARSLVREELALLDGRHPAHSAAAWLLAARIEASDGDVEAARTAVAAARAVCTLSGPLRAHALAWRELADTCAAQGFTADAVGAYQQALAAAGITRSIP